MAYVGVDCGATGLEFGLFERDNPLAPGLITAKSIPTTRDFEEDMMAVAGVLEEFVQITSIEGVGIGVAGRFNSARTKLLFAGNLPGWAGHPLAAKITSMLPGGTRMAFGNDAEALALYEALKNPELEGVDFLAWLVGSGIGTGRITWIKLDGRWVPISLPTEGQHMAQPTPANYPNPKQCGCGKYNCTERLGSGDGSAERFGVTHGRDVPKWFYRGYVAPAQALGMSQILLDHVVDCVVFGGTVARAETYLMDCVQEELAKLMEPEALPDFVRAICAKADAAVGGLTLLSRGR